VRLASKTGDQALAGKEATLGRGSRRGRAALAYNDSLTTKKLHPVTKTALDRIWMVQQKTAAFAG